MISQNNNFISLTFQINRLNHDIMHRKGDILPSNGKTTKFIQENLSPELSRIKLG